MTLMPQEPEEPRFEEMYEVVKLWSQNKKEGEIAKELGIRRVDVLDHLDNWRKSAVGSEAMKDRVEELITTMDEHYSLLIGKAYEIIEEVDTPREGRKETMTRSQMLNAKKGALDLIAKLEKDRIDVLQKSGLLEIDNLGDELAAKEEQIQFIMDLLEENLCDRCNSLIMGRLLGAMSHDTVVVSG
jgi:hypothetical protein